jgi:hypothetical protein
MRRLSRFARDLSLACTFLLIASFYFWTACTSGAPVFPEPGIDEHYNLLAKGYLSGHLSLSALPAPELLSLPDPYDPTANAQWRIHDAALFGGRYYLYFGPTPALLVFAPFRLATSLDFPQSLATALFCSAGLFFAFLLLRFLAIQLLPRPTSIWLLLAGMWALGFCSVMPFLLRRPAMYEVAISCGYALVFASLYYFATGGLVAQPRIGRLALASALLGLAGGARFPLLAAGIVPLALAFSFIWRPRPPARERTALLIALFAPLAACIFLLGWYNHARFGSWAEFGINYTLQGFHPKVYQFFSLWRLPFGVLYYIFVPLNWSATFPFARLAPHLYLPAPSFMYVEPAAGLLAHSPLLAILAGLPWIRPRDARFGTLLLISLMLGSGLLLLASVTGTTMRYEVDFATFFVMPALLLWFKTLQETGSRSAERAWVLRSVFLGLLIVSLFSNLFISFTGYYDNLKTARPRTYDAVHNLFRPIESLFSSSLKLVQVVAPNGLEQVGGQSFFWLGGAPASVVVRSGRRQDVELTMTLVPGPSADPALATRRVRLHVPRLEWSRELAVQGGPERIRVPVDLGYTVINLEALDVQTVPVQPNGDTRPLILGIQGLRVEPAV